MSDLLNRIAGGPITWGVDGSPGWGYLMDSDRVLSEMRSTGLSATELGPEGFLPTDPDQLVDYVAGYELQVVAGFVPAVLYRDRGIEDQLAYVDRANSQLAKTGSKFIVLGPDSHHEGYDTEIEMTSDEWQTFSANLERVMHNAEDHGLATAVHPHWGMAISRENEVERMLGCSEAGLCLDTGHLFLSGCDPLDIAKMAGDRVIHVHLKDVDDSMAERVRAGELPFRQAVIDGMFKPLGSGVVDIDGVIRHLEANNYRGWYVIEQDCALAEDPAPGAGPVADAASSVAFLERLAKEV
jgi:inosose dehydratase